MRVLQLQLKLEVFVGRWSGSYSVRFEMNGYITDGSELFLRLTPVSPPRARKTSFLFAATLTLNLPDRNEISGAPFSSFFGFRLVSIVLRIKYEDPILLRVPV